MATQWAHQHALITAGYQGARSGSGDIKAALTGARVVHRRGKGIRALTYADVDFTQYWDALILDFRIVRVDLQDLAMAGDVVAHLWLIGTEV